MRYRHDLVVVTNDIYTREDQRLSSWQGRSTPIGSAASRRVDAPHTAIREDASINLDAVELVSSSFPDSRRDLHRAGGDNLAATFSPELSDLTLYVIDVAAGDKIPRKGGPASCAPICSSSTRPISRPTWARRSR